MDADTQSQRQPEGLSAFLALTRAWFEETLGAPTPQLQGWPPYPAWRAYADPGADRIRQDAGGISYGASTSSSGHWWMRRRLTMSPACAWSTFRR